jgi:hypothetical protein
MALANAFAALGGWKACLPRLRLLPARGQGLALAMCGLLLLSALFGGCSCDFGFAPRGLTLGRNALAGSARCALRRRRRLSRRYRRGC